MYYNYLAAALRNLLGNKFYAAINIMGLTLGFTAAFLAMLYVHHELSYDQFIPGHENVYVAVTRVTMTGQRPLFAERTSSSLAAWLKLDLGDLMVSRFQRKDLMTVRHGDVEALEQTAWADPDLFSIL